MPVSGAKHYQICNNDVIARLILEESHQYCFRSISAGDAIMTNLSPAAALARSSIHQLTTSTDTMDLVCHGPSTVNPDAFNPYNCLGTLQFLHFVLTIRSLRLQVMRLHNRQLIR